MPNLDLPLVVRQRALQALRQPVPRPQTASAQIERRRAHVRRPDALAEPPEQARLLRRRPKARREPLEVERCGRPRAVVAAVARLVLAGAGEGGGGARVGPVEGAVELVGRGRVGGEPGV